MKMDLKISYFHKATCTRGRRSGRRLCGHVFQVCSATSEIAQIVAVQLNTFNLSHLHCILCDSFLSTVRRADSNRMLPNCWRHASYFTCASSQMVLTQGPAWNSLVSSCSVSIDDNRAYCTDASQAGQRVSIECHYFRCSSILSCNFSNSHLKYTVCLPASMALLLFQPFPSAFLPDYIYVRTPGNVATPFRYLNSSSSHPSITTILAIFTHLSTSCIPFKIHTALFVNPSPLFASRNHTLFPHIFKRPKLHLLKHLHPTICSTVPQYARAQET